MLPLALGLQMKPMRETKRRKGENSVDVGLGRWASRPFLAVSNLAPLTPYLSHASFPSHASPLREAAARHECIQHFHA